MPATMSKTKEASLRRERFREYMRKLNPTAPARTALDSGLVLEDLHGSLYKILAARADLDPGSQQLLVGGIGSGKTTELLMAEKWLEEQGQTLSLYIDISAETDLATLNAGALLAGFGVHLTRAFYRNAFDNSLADHEKKALQVGQDKIDAFAFGKTESTSVPDYFEGFMSALGDRRSVTHVPGKLKPPFYPVLWDIRNIHDSLEMFVRAVQERLRDVVVIFDGLDRLISPETFWSVVDQDFRALRRMAVGVVAAAPLSLLYGQGRAVSDHFDRIHHIHTLSSDPKSNDHLQSVLVHRGGSDLLGRDEIEVVCSASGGVLRDLVTLARDSGEQAYIEGSDEILLKHVTTAVTQLGESYRRGLGPTQLQVLKRLDRERYFDVTSIPGIELLVTGRVLEYSAFDFRVHPALKPLVENG